MGVLGVTLGGCIQVGDLGRTTMSAGADDGEWSSSTGETDLPSPTLFRGGDLTYRNLLYDLGATFSDANGQAREVAEILGEHGFDLARVRVFHDPGQPTVFSDGQTYRMHPGYQGLEDGLKTARIAAAHGMSVFVTLHYSDFWTNRDQQAMPAAWRELASLDAVLTETASYTTEAVSAFAGTGASVQYVALGNAINDRLMEYPSTGDEYRAVLRAASEAVRVAAPPARIVLHLASDAERGAIEAWVAAIDAAGIEYDVLGLSLYPFWTGWTLTEMRDFVVWAAETSQKPILICEFGALWTGESQGPYDAMGGEAYPVSPLGQRDYVAAYLDTMERASVVEGVVYWDPIWIAWPDAGWVVGQGNTEWDSALFDGEGRALPALEAFLRN